METPTKMDDLGVPLFLGDLHMIGWKRMVYTNDCQSINKWMIDIDEILHQLVDGKHPIIIQLFAVFYSSKSCTSW